MKKTGLLVLFARGSWSIYEVNCNARGVTQFVRHAAKAGEGDVHLSLHCRSCC